MPAPRNAGKPHSRASRGTDGSRTALTELPAAGCCLPVPEMPAGREWSDIERARWDELWRSPQATQWDETARGTVAALLIYESAILSSAASAWQAQEARYAAEALGLTPRALASLGWRIVGSTS
jgi:hypothetical protein